MDILSRWRPCKLEENGIQLVSTARELFETHGARFSPENRVVAESLLEDAEETRQAFLRKLLLARIMPARLYYRKANEALRRIRDMPVPPFGPLDRPNHS